MPADVQIRFRAQSKEAQRDINQLQQEFQQLRQQLRGTQQSSEAAENVMQQLGQRSRQVTREVLDLRSTTQQLNRTNAELRQGLVTADAAERKRIQSFISANNVSKALIQTDIQRAGIQKQNISLLEREAREAARLGQSFDGATRGSGLFRETLSSLGGTLGALGIDSAIFQITRFATESARASIQIDSATRALGVLVGSAAEAEVQIRAVQELADEPGLRFRQAIDGTVALRAIGVEAETTTRILRELANAAAFSGGAGEFERGLLGFRQLIQRGRLSQEELNQLTENIGLASRVIREEFGTVLAEDIQAQLNATGMSIDDFVERVLTGFERLERFPLDAPSVKLKNLGNSFFEFQAAVGDLFLPAVASGAEGLTAFLDTVTHFISVSDEATESAERFRTAIAAADGTVARDDAIQNRIRGLRDLIAEQERAVRTAGIFSHRPTLEAEAESSRVELGELERIAAGDPAKIRELRAELSKLTAELDRIVEAQSELNDASGVFRFFSAFSPENLDSLEEADIAINEQIDSTEALLESAEAAARGVTAAAQRRAAAEKAAAETTTSSTEATHGFIRSIDDFGGALSEIDTRFLTFHERVDVLTSAIRGLPPEITAVRDGFDVLAPTAERVNAIFTEYNETLGRYVAVSGIVVSSAEEEAKALDAVTQQLIQQTQDAEALAHIQEVLTQRTDAHNAALVDPAVSDPVTSLRQYVEVLDQIGSLNVGGSPLVEISESDVAARIREFADEVLTAEGMLNNFAPALGEVETRYIGLESVTDRLTASIREQTSAMDRFSRSVENANEELQTRTDESTETIDEFNQEFAAFFDGINQLESAFESLGDNSGDVLDILIGQFSQLEGVVGSLGTKIGQFDIAGLASGNPNALASLPFQLYNAFTFDQRQADARLPELDRQNQSLFERGRFGIPTDLLGFGRGQLDRAALATGTSGFGGRPLLERLQGLDPQIGRTSLDAVATLPDHIIETIQTFTDQILTGLTDELAQASFDLDFAKQSGGDVQGALQDVISANTALYQAQIDSYNLQRQATGRAVGNVDELNRTLNALNNETRQQLDNLPPNAFTAQGRIRDARALAERTGTDRQAIEDVARAQYGDVAYDAEVAAATAEALEDVQSSPEVTEQVQRAIEALETRTANRLAQSALDAISEAASDVNVTETTIVERWNAAVPQIEAWWQELYDDIINNPDLTEAERTEDLAALGSQQDFVASLKSQYVTPVLMGIAQATEALQTRTANRLAQDAISAMSEAVGDVNVTEQEILNQWTAAIPSLENWWRDLYEDIRNDPNLSDAAEAESLAALGTQQDFVANLKSQYVTPAITGIRRSAEALQTRTANRLAQEALGSLREATSDVNITETEITQLWTAALPALENWYQELLEDANAIESDAERTEAIAALGSPEQFIASLESQYVTPILTGIQRSREALETRTANRLAQDALNGLREVSADVNITEQAIAQLWTDALPLIENWYQELFEDATAIENDAERAEAIAALGRPDQFVANLRSQYVTPILTGIQRSREALETRTANRLANDALNGLREVSADVNITEAEIVALWENATPFISTWYQELLEDANAIENDAERAEAIAALGTPEQFVANLRSQYVTPVLMGIAQSTEALQTRTANREAQAVISALGTVASDVNVTEQAIIDKWEEAVPFIRTWWRDLYDDIVNNGLQSDAEIAESLAELGSVESFVGNIRSQYVTPVLNNILQTRFRNRSNRAQTGVNRARFNFGGATSESDFERRRELLIEAINTYHDAEEERIKSLKVSEEELEHLRSTNSLQRDQALRAATQATNTFEAARRRAAESAAAERLQTEARLQSDIEHLRDASLDAEREHQEAVIKLEEEKQEKILDIQRDANRRREDINREVERDFTDNFRESQEAIAALLSEEGVGAGDIRSFLSGFEGRCSKSVERVGAFRVT